MQFDFTELEPESRYRLLTNFIGPRPIALVTTRSSAGHSNAAPMSFFNVFSHDPPILILGVQPRPSGEEKDTIANIRRTGEFAVNMVDMSMAQQMLICGLGFDSEVDELEMAGLEAAACTQIDATYAATAPCALECRV
ncbi:MAG: flavin reductase family protein, partial [Bifidobacteriales bacterium]|nr:flavin reductase family protein [Bifidobacteriales bacterium]